jgi:hypothetical protein
VIGSALENMRKRKEPYFGLRIEGASAEGCRPGVRKVEVGV